MTDHLASFQTFHPITVSDQRLMTQFRTLAEPNKGKLRGIQARVPFDEIVARASAPEGVAYRKDTIGGIEGWWCEPVGAPEDCAILHLHGGWFNWGSAESFRHLVGHIARSARVRAFIPNYRLAPEYRFPAGLNDARNCLDALVQSGLRAVVVTGDSAGGNLALVLLSMIGSMRSVAGGVVLSPVTDLTLSNGSWTSRAEADPLFLRDQAQGLVDSYLDGQDAKAPSASPLFGNFANLPPIRVHVGNDEVLRDDSLRYVEKAIENGADATVDVWEGMIHGFLGNVGRLEASDAALQAIGAFIRERFAMSRPIA